jgi:hypothetical protein
LMSHAVYLQHYGDPHVDAAWGQAAL